MDISDIVEGMPKKKSRRKEETSRSHGGASSSSQRDGSHRHTSHKTPAGSSASHSRSHQKHESESSPGSSSSSFSARESSGKGKKADSSSRIQCELCERTFESKTKFDQHCLVFHRRSKVPAKPKEALFPCSECGKAFTSPSKRTIHENATHLGIKPYHCDKCPKSFGYRGDLTKHKASHSGIKAYSCYICGARFARNFYVKRHIETVHEKKGAQKKE